MGTDIHLFTERRESADAPWQLFAVKSTCSWCIGSGKHPPHMPDKPCWKCKGGGVETGYGERNYSTFAMLASVCNGTGFAGVDTGEGFNPIAMPRDLPADMSAELKAIHSEEYSDERYSELDAKYGESNLGDHSFSHLSLRELLNYDWQQKTLHRGQAELKHFAAWKASGDKFPKEWCGDCSGRAVRQVPERLATLLAGCVIWEPFTAALTDFAKTAWAAHGLDLHELEQWASGTLRLSIYAPVRVEDTYANSAGHFYSSFLPALAAAGTVDDVRIVFGFDS